MQNHFNIPPIKAFVREGFLYQDNNNNNKDLVPIEIFGISTYKGEVITFNILLEDGSIFNYVPFTEVFIKKYIPEEDVELRDLIYHNCNSLAISVNYYTILEDKKGYAFLKYKNIWRVVDKYFLTIDFYTGNDLLHLLGINNRFYLLPNHKVLFKQKGEKVDFNALQFNQYKKVKGIFKVT